MELRDYQNTALTKLAETYDKGHSRATLVLPCGTGKTLVAARMIPTARGCRTVIFVPTLALLHQTWRTLQQLHPALRLVGACSPPSAAKTEGGDDLPRNVVADLLGADLTTDPDKLADYLRTEQATVILATYASSPTVTTAAESAGITFDLLIGDEAHRSAGTTDKKWATPVHKIPAHRRLFMTATPRTVTIDESTADLDDATVVSMNSLTDYGPHICPIGFRQAITDGWLSDYTIAMIGVAERDAYHQLTRSAVTSGHRATTAATQLALLNAVNKYGVRSVLVFHNSIEHSRAWVNELRHAAAARHMPLYAEHLDGTTDPAQRAHMLDRLAHPDRLSVISNCKVFSEGIDVPALDAVMLAEPRTGGPDIIQIVGRAIRPHPDPTKKALVILPVLDFADDSADLDTKAARTSYLAAWQVLTALAEEDELLHHSIARWACDTEPQPSTTDDHALLDVDVATLNAVAQQFALRTIAKASSPHLITATRLRAFYDHYGHCNPHPSTITADGFPLAARLKAARTAYRAGRLHPRVVAAFEAIPHFEWKSAATNGRRTVAQWIALVAHHISETGLHTIARSQPATDPETGKTANLGAWLHKATSTPGYLTADEERRLRATGVRFAKHL